MSSCNVRAYAKINLSLEITGKRNDGYHLISSVMQAISLHDDVSVRISNIGNDEDHEGAPRHRISVGADFAPGAQAGAQTLPQGADNLAHDAAALALKLWGGGTSSSTRSAAGPGGHSAPRTDPRYDVRITISKRIPVAAGLAGGSADAAAVLLALAHMLPHSAGLQEVMEAGTDIGADVPFCTAAIARTNPDLGYAEDAHACHAALCEGIGDIISKEDPVKGWAVLIRPDAEVSSNLVYSDWDKLNPATLWPPAPHDSDNDLIPAAVRRYPVIGRILNEVNAAVSADRVFMTGSGPTIVALYADESAASSTCVALKDRYKNRADVGAVILTKLLPD